MFIKFSLKEEMFFTPIENIKALAVSQNVQKANTMHLVLDIHLHQLELLLEWPLHRN